MSATENAIAGERRTAPSQVANAKTPTYWDYVKVDALLSLQSGLAADETSLTNDEVMFIAIHQVDELWFKIALRELVVARDRLATSEVGSPALGEVVVALRRAALVFRQATQHFELMETLTTRGYLAFRDKLAPASGYQSAQFRELEILLGIEEGERVACGQGSSYLDALREAGGNRGPACRRVEARLRDRPSLCAAALDWVSGAPIDGSRPGDPGDDGVVLDFVCRYLDVHAREAPREREAEGARTYLHARDVPPPEQARVRRVRAALVFLESYGDRPLLVTSREVLESLIAFEQSFVVFRQRHARMVERIIGARGGTGGSAGVAYLDRTATSYRVFREVAAARTVLVRDAVVPPLTCPDFYDFASHARPPRASTIVAGER